MVGSMVLTASDGFDFSSLPPLAQDMLACMTAMQPLPLHDPALANTVRLQEPSGSHKPFNRCW